MPNNQTITTGMKPANKRFAEVMQHLGYKQAQMAEALGINQGTISGILNNKLIVNEEILARLATKLNIDIYWMMFGTGSMIRNTGPVEQVIVMDTEGKENVLFVPMRAYGSYVKSLEDPVHLKDCIPFKAPFLAQHGIRVFEVYGNSMQVEDRGIHEGDSVWCTETNLNELRNGRVHAVVTDDTILIKRVYHEKGRDYITIRSDNPAYKNERLSLKDEVKQLWYARAHMTFQMPDPSNMEVRLAEVERQVFELQKNMSKELVKKL